MLHTILDYIAIYAVVSVLVSIVFLTALRRMGVK